MKNTSIILAVLTLGIATMPFVAFADNDAAISRIASLLESLKAAVLSIAEQIQQRASLQKTNAIDITNDGIVGIEDWNYMESRWFSNDKAADINGDGIVNSIDFGLLNRGWNTSPR